MRFRSVFVAVYAALVLVLGVSPVSAQAAAYQRISGTWVMDSTNGPDDHGLPKSETLAFAPTGHGIRITATEDNGHGPGTSNIDCTSVSGHATASMATGTSTQCTVRVTADSVAYALDVVNKGAVVATERGRLVLSDGGRTLRDEYDATDGANPATHHRHIYTKHAAR